MPNVINATSTGNGGLITQGDDSGILNIQTNDTTAITVDASQNVGIGVTPSGWSSSNKALQVGVAGAISAQTSAKTMEIACNAYNNGGWKYIASDYATHYYQYNGTHVWEYASSGTAGNAVTFNEAMRINSSGELLVGNTTNLEGGKFDVSASGRVAGFTTNASGGSQDAINVANQANASFNAIRFWTGGTADVGGTLVGRINCTTSATSYVTSSDYRLKENIVPMVGALNKVLALKPVTYKWKQDGSNGQGFIAHELQEICPDAVVGTKDALNENGDPDYQGIDTSFLVATLTAAIQEQQTTINALTARIVALETA